MGTKKGKKVSQLHESTGSNSLETGKMVEGHAKAPGQVGLHAPNTADAVRRAKAENRKDTGDRAFGGISPPRVSEQTYDCYNPIRKDKKK